MLIYIVYYKTWISIGVQMLTDLKTYYHFIYINHYCLLETTRLTFTRFPPIVMVTNQGQTKNMLMSAK